MPSLWTHDILLEDRSSGSPKLGYMLARQNGRRRLLIQDYQTIAPRQLTMGEITQAEYPVEAQALWNQENWQAGMGLVNQRIGLGSVGIAKGYKIDTTSPSGIIRVAKELIVTTVDSVPNEYKPSGFATCGTEAWAFIGRDAYTWDYTNKNWDIGTEPVAAARFYRNGVEYEGNTYVPAWANDAGSGGSYVLLDQPSYYIYKADADANWTVSTLGTGSLDAAKYITKADGKLWAGYITSYADTTENLSAAFDVATSDYVETNTVLTFSHTVGTGTNRLLIVGIGWERAAGVGTVSTVTYGGVSLTRVGGNTSGNDGCDIWRLINPTSGAANVVVTMSAGNCEYIVAGATSYIGVHQTTPLGAIASATGTSTAVTVAVTTVDGDLAIDVVHIGTDATITQGAGQTERWNQVVTTTGRGYGSSESATTTSTTMSSTLSGSTLWLINGVAIKNAALNNSATSLNTSATPSSNIAAGDVIRMGNDLELMLVSAVADTPPALTVVRGYRGTAAATHTASSIINKLTMNKHHVRSSSDGTNTGTWAAATAIGDSSAEITALVAYHDGTNELALICKTDGLWTLNAAGTEVHLFNMKAQQHPNNFRGAFSLDGNRRVILPLGAGGMYELYNDVVRDISFSQTMPDQTWLHGRVVAGAADAVNAFVLTQEVSTLKYHLMMAELVDIGGSADYRWHHVGAVAYTTDTVEEHAALFAEGVPSGSIVHHRIHAGIESTGSNLLPYFYPLANDAEVKYSNDTDMEVVTVADDRNLPNVSKRYGSVDFTTANLGANDYWEVKYRVDGGSWTWLTGAQGTSKLTTTPQTLTFGAEITGKKIELQFLPTVTATATSPEILDFTLKAQVRTDALSTLPLALYLADGQMLRNNTRQHTCASDLNQLRAWAEQAAELTATMPDEVTGGTAYNVVFIRGTLRIEEAHARHGARPGYVASFLLVEV